ncbi:hypothetical protein [Aeromicrobium alkaliterrae]|uniref:hypothetical protein n=1 Tax=Aeromicrobium alkaliterrae TaxID=302168 RepID=UPI0031DF84EB
MFPRVYRLATTQLDRAGLIAAAVLALPDDVVVSHMTRLELVGVRLGPPTLHFTVARDLHRPMDGVMLHRTVKLPPLDRVGASISAAWVQTASTLRPLDVVAAGDHVLRKGLATPESFAAVADLDPWRPGAGRVAQLLPLIDSRSASVQESRTRVSISAAGLEPPEVNASVFDGPQLVAVGDLVGRRWKLLVEYEGRQHALDPQQFAWDIERYRILRQLGWQYLQVTARDLANPVRLVRLVHRALVAQGYDGPPPSFGELWQWCHRAPRPSEFAPS